MLICLRNELISSERRFFEEKRALALRPFVPPGFRPLGATFFRCGQGCIIISPTSRLIIIRVLHVSGYDFLFIKRVVSSLSQLCQMTLRVDTSLAKVLCSPLAPRWTQ